MNSEIRFHTLRWIRVNSGSIAGCEVEEFIDTTRNYFKTVWADGYTEITKLHAIHTGQAIKEPKTLSNLSVYKSPKIRYNIYVNKTKDGTNNERRVSD
jgi:hypothetical protein